MLSAMSTWPWAMFAAVSTPRGPDIADDGLAAFVDVNVLNRDLLLAFATMTIERVQQNRKGTAKLIGLRQTLTVPLERLLTYHRPPVAFH
jgi:hypothetical protein